LASPNAGDAWQIALPQLPQKIRVTAIQERISESGFTETVSMYAPVFPLGTLILNSLVGPSILRSLSGTMMFELNALPDVCLQSQQWHKT
jgi:hypothetical protein